MSLYMVFMSGRIGLVFSISKTLEDVTSGFFNFTSYSCTTTWDFKTGTGMMAGSVSVLLCFW
jgi:hypothetical protein